MHALLKSIVVHILTWESRLVLKRYAPRIIAVTGSAGKTTTKDAIYSAIHHSVHVRKSEKSFNSDVGVPLAILGCDNAWGSAWGWIANIVRGAALVILPSKYPDWLVLEVGADRPGDISSIAQWLRPDVAVITSIPDVPVHVEFFPSPDDVEKEKRSLAEHMKPTGTLVINGDEPRTSRVRESFRDRSLAYGFEGHNDVRATHDAFAYENNDLAGMKFTAHMRSASHEVVVHGALGRPRIYAALAALAVAESIGVPFDAAVKGLREWSPPPGRMRIIPGLKDSLIIDDTYNSSPVAAGAALETLINIPSAKKRIAVLGDMLELGKYSPEAHRALGRKSAECADQLVTIGFRSRAIAEAAMDSGMSEKKIRQYEHGESERAGKELENDLGPGVVVLIKGSQSMRMERTVKEIMADPERAPELLVRQEEEWLER